MQSTPLPEVSTVEDLLNQGMSIKEISAALNLSLIKAKQFISDHNLVDRLQNMSYWPWDDQEDDQLRNELEQRQALEQIAETHRRTVGAVKSRIRNLNLETAPAEGEPAIPKKPRWSDQHIEEALRMKEAGQSIPDISRALGRTEKAVAAKLKKLKASHQPSRPKPSGQPKLKKTSIQNDPFACPCSGDRVRVVFGCGHGGCHDCSRKLRLCPECEQDIRLRLELAF